MRRKIKKMDCIEYLSVQAPLEKVNMLKEKRIFNRGKDKTQWLFAERC